MSKLIKRDTLLAVGVLTVFILVIVAIKLLS
jgi:hypothetical protein